MSGDILLVIVVGTALVRAIGWNLITWYHGLPSSSGLSSPPQSSRSD